MNKKIIFIIITCIVFSQISCKKKQDISQINDVLQKWGRAINELNYSLYKTCEAYPKSYPVFKEMYTDYYFQDIMIVKAEPFDDERKRKDPEGNEYMHLAVDFECTEVKRKTNNPVQLIRGNVVLINFLQGDRKDDGWLMSNRTFIRVKR